MSDQGLASLFEGNNENPSQNNYFDEKVCEKCGGKNHLVVFGWIHDHKGSTLGTYCFGCFIKYGAAGVYQCTK